MAFGVPTTFAHIYVASLSRDLTTKFWKLLLFINWMSLNYTQMRRICGYANDVCMYRMLARAREHL